MTDSVEGIVFCLLNQELNWGFSGVGEKRPNYGLGELDSPTFLKEQACLFLTTSIFNHESKTAIL